MDSSGPADPVRKRRFLNLHRANPTNDAADDLAFHDEMRAQLLMQRGVAESVAKQEALRRLETLIPCAPSVNHLNARNPERGLVP